MLNLEARVCEVQAQIQSLKHKTYKAVDKGQESLDFTGGEQSDLVERIMLCETEKSIKWNVSTHQSIYS